MGILSGTTFKDVLLVLQVLFHDFLWPPYYHRYLTLKLDKR